MKKKKVQFKIENFYFLVVIFSFAFFLFNFGEAKAAELNLTSQAQEIGIGQQFQVDLFLNTENEEINATEGKIIFPSDLLEFKEIRDGNSIINFWIEKPRVERPGVIVFSGITPGGYQETKGFIFSVVFQAKTSGSGAIEIHDAKVLLDDGRGTPAKTTISNFQFSISEEIPSSEFQIPDLKDTDPPEEFKPEIVQNADMFDGKYFLVFATQDKKSGIDHYEVCERSKRKCVIAESPYVLRDQKLNSYIWVKAIDKSGNKRIAELPPQNPLEWYKNYLIWVIIISGGVIGYIICRILWLKFYAKK